MTSPSGSIDPRQKGAGSDVSTQKGGRDGAPPRARDRALGARREERPVVNRPNPAERERLAATLGVLLWQLRMERGMGTRLLARRSAVTRNTIRRLEAGERRPRRSLLAGIGYGLNPDDPKPITDALAAAAGNSLVPEGPWSERRRRRAMDRAILSGAAPLRSDLAKRLALHRSADRAWWAALKLIDGPVGWGDDAAVREAHRLLTLSHALRDQAGPPITIHVGRHQIRAGFYAP